jgi:hypothetical protein
MKQFKKVFFLSTLFFTLFTAATFAQGGGDEDPFGDLEGGDPPPATPIDTNIYYLVVAAAMFGGVVALKKTKQVVK